MQNSVGYLTKWKIDNISSNPDLVSSQLVLSVQPSGSYDIIKKTGAIFTSVIAGSTTAQGYTNQTVSFQANPAQNILVKPNTTSEKYLNLLYNSYIEKSPSLTCSSTSTVTFSLAGYNGGSVPSWVSINSSSGLLSMTTPNITVSTNYTFYINSDVSGTVSTIQKLITIGVTQCLVNNCDTWSTTDTTVWVTWSYYYAVSSGSCTQDPSAEINSINIATKSMIGAQALITTTVSAFTNSSFSSLWSMINQLQLFLLLLLTGVYFPKDVIDVIIGSKFALFTINYIPFQNLSLSTFIIGKINFSQSFGTLQRIGFDSGSSFVNNYGMLFTLALIIIFHLFILLIVKLLFSNEPWKRWSKCYKVLSWILIKTFNFLTFGYYIRLTLESYQYTVKDFSSSVICLIY